MKHAIRNIIYILIATAAATSCQNNTDDIINELEQAITDKKIYEQKKEEEIAKIHNLLNTKEHSCEFMYEVNNRLYEAYRKFRLDSAIHYQKRNLELAAAMNDSRRLTETRLKLVPLHSFMGQFIEGKELLDAIDRNTIPKELLPLYYDANNQFYFHYSSVTHLDEYTRLHRLYLDSMFMTSDKNSLPYQSHIIYKNISENRFDEAEEILMKMAAEHGEESPKRAEIEFAYGTLENKRGNKKAAKEHLYQSAIYDIKNAIKENASFRALALICEQEGDIDRAIEYSQLAIDDAVFSNIQFRAAQIYEFYSIINASYKHKQESTNRQLRNALIFISLFAILLASLLYYLYKLMRRTTKLREHISTINSQLKSLNHDLNEKNRELSVLNNVKEQYIANFFDLCSGYIYKMDEYRQSLHKLLMNRELDALRKKLKSRDIIDTELELLHKNFDTVFLTIYPNFVKEFNSMLRDEEQIVLKTEGTLNLELRIYALIRLGIKNNGSIASFLHCAVSTVYNYRGKIRGKTKDEFREKFEEIIAGTAVKSVKNGV